MNRRRPRPISGAPYSLDEFVSGHRFHPTVQSDWIYTTPEAVARFEVSAEDQANHDAFGYRSNYLWNEHLKDDYYRYSGIFEALPTEIRLYEAPWQSIMPRYRYPQNTTLPGGLTTNRYGWRGTRIRMRKPPNTIRIAAVGASTTVGGHTLPYSYPELLQHWLNLWSEHHEYGVKFEVINAGREGLGSNDIAAVVRYEILPMDVDYVIYYEGSNQFSPQTVVSYPPDVTFGQPPAGIVPNLANVDSTDKTLLDKLSEYSALAARARSIVEQFSVTGLEPPKPEQALVFPEELDEFRPQRKNLGNALALRRILGDLDQIKQDLDEQEVTMLLATFTWFAHDGMVLDPARHRNLYAYLNRVYWPISYANMSRLSDFQNRVFKRWAADNRVAIIEVAERMPAEPDLYDDAIHNTLLGTRIRAWINFETLVPLLKRQIDRGDLPRPARLKYVTHPYIRPGYQTERLPE